MTMISLRFVASRGEHAGAQERGTPGGARGRLPERTNMVYMGTLVTGGQGLAVVVATARFTEMGRLQMLVGEAAAPETPMERQLRRIGNQLVALSGAICGGVFALGLLRGYGLVEMLKTSVALAVAAVPEGLPTVALTTMALGVKNMRRHHVLVRRLDAVATLGAVQVICFDKTGTITLNRMSVVRLYTAAGGLGVADTPPSQKMIGQPTPSVIKPKLGRPGGEDCRGKPEGGPAEEGVGPGQARPP
jgi:magnesium-transporting ATPase (P-type)